MSGVDTCWGQDEAADLQVRGGKAKFVAHLCPTLNCPCQGITPAEHLTCKVEIARGNCFTNAGAADWFLVE